MILDLSFCDCYVFFGVLLESIEDLPFAIVIDGGMISSVSVRVQLVREDQLDMRSWTIECSHQDVHKIGILSRNSAISFTNATCWHRNSSR
jgi:hypothetical protein